VLAGSLVLGRTAVGLAFGARVTWGVDAVAVALLVPVVQLAVLAGLRRLGGWWGRRALRRGPA
jgi:hypothetical protein